VFATFNAAAPALASSRTPKSQDSPRR